VRSIQHSVDQGLDLVNDIECRAPVPVSSRSGFLPFVDVYQNYPMGQLDVTDFKRPEQFWWRFERFDITTHCTFGLSESIQAQDSIEFIRY